MELLFDGWSVLLRNAHALIVLCLAILGLGAWGKHTFLRDVQPEPIARALLTVNLGTLALFWASAFLVLLAQYWPGVSRFVTLSLVFGYSFFLIWRIWTKTWVPDNSSVYPLWIAMGLCGILYLLLRLAFISELILPPYDDSPDHYLIITDLLHEGFASSASIFSQAGRYYHIGFHILAAWLAAASDSDPASVMTLLGQFFIFFSSLSVMLLTMTITGNVPSGFAAALLAAFAWRMPAFAANWGKYPAIAGLALLPGWLALIYLLHVSSRSKSQRLFWFVAVAAALSFIHTRLFICLLSISAGWALGKAIWPDLVRSRAGVPIYLLVLIFILIQFLRPLSLFYSNNLYLSLLLVIVLAPFGVISFPRAAVGILIALVGVSIAMITPIGFMDGYGVNWLDRPFVEMLLYIPLSLLAGLGVAGVWLAPLRQALLVRSLVLIILIATIGPNVLSRELHYPDECCNYVTEEDVRAIAWLGEESPADAVIWIAGFKPRNYMIGTDGGVWIFPFTGRNVNKLAYDIAWSPATIRSKICQAGANRTYIYQGGGDFSFDPQELASNKLLRLEFRDGSTRIYSVACPL